VYWALLVCFYNSIGCIPFFYGLSTSYLDYMLPVFNLFFSPCIPISNSVHFTGLALIYGGLMGGVQFLQCGCQFGSMYLVRRLWGSFGGIYFILFGNIDEVGSWHIIRYITKQLIHTGTSYTIMLITRERFAELIH